MHRKKLIAGLLAASMLMGFAACDRNSGERSSGEDGSAEDGIAEETVTEGTIKVTIAETSDEADGTSEAATDPVVITDINISDFQVPDGEPEKILFKYTYHNMAWGYQSSCTIITGNGNVYTFKDTPALSEDYNTGEIELLYLQEYAEPTGHIDPAQLEELYEVCCSVSPDVETRDVHTAYDAGEHMFICVDQQEQYQFPILVTGDKTMETDDPALLKAQELAEEFIAGLARPNADIKLSLYSYNTSAPYGGTELIGTHIVFDSFDKLVSYCEENGIELDVESVRDQLGEASYILLQVFDTDQRMAGMMITDDKVLQLLPSLGEFEHDPAYDGKVCVGITRFEGFKEGQYVDENGDPWIVAT